VDGNCVNSRWRAFVYRAGTFTILGTLGGNDSFGLDINDAGLAVGYSATPVTPQNPGEDAQQLSVRAEGPAGVTTLLPVEHVGRVPGFPALTQITVRLADGLNAGGDFQLSLTLRGASSNKATLSISAF
jgi:hypothetical protein